MAEEAVSTAQEAAEEVATNEVEQDVETTDYKAKYEAMRQHSREWEKRAKENAAAADELEALKQAQLTEQEKANARAEKAESELAALKAEAKRKEDARAIANETGVPLELLEYCADKDAMERFVSDYKDQQPTVHAAGKAKASQVVTGSKATVSQEGQFVKDLFRRD